MLLRSGHLRGFPLRAGLDKNFEGLGVDRRRRVMAPEGAITVLWSGVGVSG
jgi:hypothetical protein